MVNSQSFPLSPHQSSYLTHVNHNILIAAKSVCLWCVVDSASFYFIKVTFLRFLYIAELHGMI